MLYVLGSLPTQVGNLNKLTELYIDTNSFSGQILFILDNIFTDKSKILIDIIKKNFIKIKSFLNSGSLPTQIGNLTALVDFQLYTNSFSGYTIIKI